MRLLSKRTASLLRAVKQRLGFRPKLFMIWHRQNSESWLERNMTNSVMRIPETPRDNAIEAVAAKINASGPQPLWKGYKEVYESDNSVPLSGVPLERMPDQVRT